MPKMHDATKSKKLASRFLIERCRAAVIQNKLSYIGYTSDVDANGNVQVLAYGHEKGNPAKVTYVALKDRAIVLAVIKGEAPAGYGEKSEETVAPSKKSGK